MQSSNNPDSPDEQPTVDRFGLIGGVVELVGHVLGVDARILGR